MLGVINNQAKPQSWTHWETGANPESHVFHNLLFSGEMTQTSQLNSFSLLIDADNNGSRRKNRFDWTEKRQQNNHETCHKHDSLTSSHAVGEEVWCGRSDLGRGEEPPAYSCHSQPCMNFDLWGPCLIAVCLWAELWAFALTSRKKVLPPDSQKHLYIYHIIFYYYLY